ncbi:L domain-like protein, partial [Caulochytrium protostelioides]
LESLPEEICQMKRLKILDVTHNQLTTLPRGIDRMTQLRQLYLSYNRLTCEAFAVEDMTSLPLQVLHLASNDLPDLPESFMAFQSSLEVLDVSYNALITLPEWLGQFERLSFLNIAHNRLRTITPALAGLTKL